jgi:hypothetical protein
VSIIPLAIRLNSPPTDSQLDQQTSTVPPTYATSPLLTRLDSRVAPDGSEYTDWMVGKMWVRSADVHYRLLGSLVGFRLLMETVSLSLYRSLPAVHPIYKLLTPHLANLVGLNTVYRRYVLEPPAPETAQDATSPTGKSSGGPTGSGGALALVLALGDRPSRGLCAQFVAEILKSVTIESLNIRKNFERLNLIGVPLPGKRP